MINASSKIILKGDVSLFKQSPALILNSRQTKTPLGSDEWVRNSVDACKHLIGNGRPLIASIGMNTWELILWSIGEFNGRGIIICPVKSTGSIENSIEKISCDFNLNPDNHTWAFIPVPQNSRSEKSWWTDRDQLAFEIAGNILPVSIRDGGCLDTLIGKELDKSEKSVDLIFKTGYKPGPKERTKLVVPESCPVFLNWYHLTHWTCRTYKPWPGEKSSDFFRAIVNSRTEYPRSASCTLKRILAENRLRASGSHIRNETPVVALTSLEPCDALKLMKWRKRYVRPTFEPYGIAIFYRPAMKMGIRLVKYSGPDEDRNDADIAPELTQGYGKGDWPKEQEWRSIGDVDLSLVPDEEAIVLVPSKEEVEEFQKLTRFEVRPLEEG